MRRRRRGALISALDLASCHHPRLCRVVFTLKCVPPHIPPERGRRPCTLHRRKREDGEVGRCVGVTRDNEIGGDGLVCG
jgi:hypothetical protein